MKRSANGTPKKPELGTPRSMRSVAVSPSKSPLKNVISAADLASDPSDEEDGPAMGTPKKALFGFQSKKSTPSFQRRLDLARKEEPEDDDPPKTPTKKGRKGEVQGIDVVNADRSHSRRRTRRVIQKTLEGESSSDEDEESDLEQEEQEDDDAIVEHTNIKSAPHGSGYESYFSTLQSKTTTSNNTLSQMPQMEHATYLKTLASLPVDHPDERANLLSLHKELFAQWAFELSVGFNLLLYGYGSKRNLLTEFVREHCSERPVLVVNGFSPSLTLRGMLESIAGALEASAPDAKLHFGNQPADILTNIVSFLSSPDPPLDDLVLLIHNIDGETLRPDKVQTAISLLAEHPRIHLIASIDHVNAPLLWDAAKSEKLRFIWHDATTFEPLKVETSFDANVLGVAGSGARAGGLRGIKYVLSSLTSNARGIYLQLLLAQLASDSESDTDGIPYRTLYDNCVTEFLVSNELTFRTQLREFYDHNMVVSRKDQGGLEVLSVPLAKGEIETLVVEMQEEE
ncbi:ORC2-domain-containing protein [Saitoella complicata NRRL Y-17804]|nr:ORC2-domain-containing protein [Saitoella complicata NRRL Y-17804]ODQ52499.1 ORC2-domain-containing protein [Saitoella complicata NRRL Y-17804]